MTARLAMAPTDEVDLSAVFLGCRMAVCEAYHYDGPCAALEELARSSLTLAGYVADGSLLTSAAFDPLQEVAENLTLVRRFGQDAVQAALAYGPHAYAEHRRALAAIGRAA